MSSSHRSVRGWRCIAHRRKALALCGAVLVLAAQAASVSEQDLALQRDSMATHSAGGSALDRALRVDTSAGQRNLDLLLEAHTAGEAPAVSAPPPVGPPSARRSAALLPQVPGQMQAPVATSDVTSAATSAAAPTAGLEVALPDAAPHLPAVADPGVVAQREWLGAAPGGVGLDGRSGQPIFAGVPQAMDTGNMPQRTDFGMGRDTDAEVPITAVLGLVHGLREYRYWLLAGLAVVGLMAAGIQAFARRSALRQPLPPEPDSMPTEPHHSRSHRRRRRRSSSGGSGNSRDSGSC